MKILNELSSRIPDAYVIYQMKLVHLTILDIMFQENNEEQINDNYNIIESLSQSISLETLKVLT